MSKVFLAACGLAGLAAVGTFTPAAAGPVPTSVASINSAVTNDATTVQYRRWGGRYYGGGRGYYRPWGWGWGGFGAGVAAGALVGAAVAAPYYYGPRFYYGPGAYYGGPAGRCWVSTAPGRGYWTPC